MAAVDALVVGNVIFAVWAAVRNQETFGRFGSVPGSLCVGVGVLMLALYYGFDFVVMGILPHIAAPQTVLNLIEVYHNHGAWLVGSYCIVLIVWGLLMINRQAARRIVRQQDANERLQWELEARAAAEAELKDAQRRLRDEMEKWQAASEEHERRGHELARLNAELRDARDRADEANRSKSEFLALMSHELRTPLNAVIGFSEMIKDESYGPVGSVKYREYARDIHSSGRHLLQIINDILDLSKIEAGAEQLIEELFIAADVARSALTLVQGRASRAGVGLHLDLPETPVALMADQRKLKQVLTNLLSNAVKYTNVGGQCVLKICNDGDAGMRFIVSDTGIGIASSDMPVVMKRFGQVPNRHNRKLAGSGLGLPLTKSLIEMHGGALSIESTVGVGTTVTVHLPPERVLDPASVTGRFSDFDASDGAGASDRGPEILPALSA